MMSPIHIFIFLYFIKLTFKHHENQTNYTFTINFHFLHRQTNKKLITGCDKKCPSYTIS